MTWSAPAVPPQGPPPGWYHDAGSNRWLWWDGWRWVLPEAPPPPANAWFPATPALQLPAALMGIAFIVLLTVATRLTDLLPETPAALVALALFAVSVIGMPLAAWFGSKRWGTGRFIDDIGIRTSWIDLPLAVAGAIGLTIAMTVVNVAFHAFGAPNGSNLTEVADNGRSVALFVVLFIQAGLLAPITEELLFRGLIQRGLDSRFSIWISVLLQGIVFGSAHITPSEGWGNVSLCVSLAVMGVGLGGIARITGRLGTSMWTHAFFNCIQLTLFWISLG